MSPNPPPPSSEASPLRRELPWLVAEVVLLVVLAYRIERFVSSGER